MKKLSLPRISLQGMLSGVTERFAVPAGMSVLLTVLMIVWTWWRSPNASPAGLERCAMAAAAGLCWSLAGCLLAESLWREDRRTLLSLGGAVLAAGLSFLLNRPEACAGLCVAAGLCCLYLCSRGLERPIRLERTLTTACAACALALLAFLTLEILISAVFAFFLPQSSWSLRSSIETTAGMLSLCLAAPLLFMGLLPELDMPVSQQRSAVRWILAWIALPAYLLLLGILLGYLVTALVRWEMPVGQINPYTLLALGVYAALHLTLTGEENRLSAWFCRWGAWPLLPVLLGQAAAVGIRVGAYGLTPARVLGMAFTLACLIPVGAGLCRQRAFAFLPAAAAIVLLVTLTPLSAGNLARLNQEGRLKAALQRAGMLDAQENIAANPDAPLAERDAVWSSVSALRGWDLPENSFSKKTLRRIQEQTPEKGAFSDGYRSVFGFPPVGGYRSETKTAEGTATRDSLDVAGFSHASYYYGNLNGENRYSLQAGSRTVRLEDVLPLADFEAGRFTREEIPFEDGSVLRLCKLESHTYSGSEPRYFLSCWLLTP